MPAFLKHHMYILQCLQLNISFKDEELQLNTDIYRILGTKVSTDIYSGTCD